MFSILIRYRNGEENGREVITAAKAVEWQGNRAKKGAGLLLRMPDDTSQHLELSPKVKDGQDEWRDVFVMNDNGQTVARYSL